jgi:hypothetical protein
VYNLEIGPREYISLLAITLCQNTEFLDNKGSKWYTYQGNSTQELIEYIADLTNRLAVSRLDEDSLVIIHLSNVEEAHS